jgi:hypothetical protein
MDITQVIKILVIIRIRILATDSCVASEYIFIYWVYNYGLVYSSLL